MKMSKSIVGATIFTLATAAVIALTVSTVSTTSVQAAKPPVYSQHDVAIRGTDPVGYFTEGMPVAGKKEFALEWNGTMWHFASQANRDAFEAEPEAYAPQYGGYCAFAVARGYTASTVPEAWEIVDGKLYLNYSLGVRDSWRQDIPGNIIRGDENWPRVLY